MKIGIYDPYLDDCGGGERYMATIAECLSKEHEVSVFWDEKEDFEKVGKRFGLDLSRISLEKDIFSPSFGFSKRLFATQKYDLLIILSDGSIPLTLSRRLFLHIQRPIEGAGRGFKNRLKKGRISKIICNSYFTKSYIDKKMGMDSVVLYPPVDLKPKKIKKENVILHVGRFRVVDRTIGKVKDYKKQYIMLEAFKKISKKIPNWKFELAVSVNDEDMEAFEDFKSKAKNLPVEFHINRPLSELWELYSRAKIYWHASGFGENLEEHPEYAEHFGISTVEAMGAGAVPVVINAGGQKEIVENGVNGFLWESLEDLEEKTMMLTEESKIRENMSEEAVKRAKVFSGDRFCEEVNQLVNHG